MSMKIKRSINEVQNPINRTFVIKLFTYASTFLIIHQFGKVKIIIETVQRDRIHRENVIR